MQATFSYFKLLPPPALLILASAFCLNTAVALHPAAAAEAFPRELKAEPIDPSSPDVAAFRARGEAKTAKTKSLFEEHGVPEDQMFAIINPERSPSDAGKRGEDAKTLAAETANCPVELVESDPSGMRAWFQVNYGAPCNLVQYCNWVVDPKIDTPDEIRAQEAELESKSASAPQEEEKADQNQPAKSGGEDDPEASDPHLNNYDQIEREVVLAGTRRCRLTRQCTGKDDPLCTKEFLDLKASQIEIEQLGK